MSGQIKIVPSISHDLFYSCKNCMFHVFHHKSIYCGFMWHDLKVNSFNTCQYHKPIDLQTKLF